MIAGGFRAVKEAIEGAEDSEELGEQDINENGINEKDVVLGIAASGRTFYVLGAMRRAKERGLLLSVFATITNRRCISMPNS